MNIGVDKRAWFSVPALLLAGAIGFGAMVPAAGAAGVPPAGQFKGQAAMQGIAGISPEATGQVRYETNGQTAKFELLVQKLDLQPQGVEPDPTVNVFVDGQMVNPTPLVYTHGQVQLKVETGKNPDVHLPVAHSGSKVEVRLTPPAGATAAQAAQAQMVALGTL